MRNYELTELAQRDVDEILEFIAVRKGNPDGAQVVLDYLHSSMQALADNPNLGHFRVDLTDRPVKFYRGSKNHKYYIVFDPECSPIRILRVTSIRRDFVSLFEDTDP